MTLQRGGRLALVDRFGTELAPVWGMTETGALCVGSEPGYRGELGDNSVGVPINPRGASEPSGR